MILDDPSCKWLVICEAAQESSKLGQVVKVVAKTATLNTSGWLEDKNTKKGNDVPKAGRLAAKGQDCAAIYSCLRKPRHYKFPTAEIGRNGNDAIINNFLSLLNYF